MDSSQPLRILALGHDLSSEGCTYARIITPLEELATRGEIVYDYMRILPWRVGAVRSAFHRLAQSDVILMARPRHSIMLPIIERVHALGKAVLIDLDDWLLDVPPDHLDARHVRRRPRQETLRWALRAADGITVSTPHLAGRCSALGLPAYVMHNAIDVSLYARHPRDPDLVTIAYVGSSSHARDVSLVGRALRHVLRADDGRLRVVTVGCAIPELAGLSAYTHHGSVTAGVYPRLLSDLRIDIGLAPLQDTSFNRSKSDIKYLEYTAAGAVTVASAVGPYPGSVTASRGVLIERNTAQEWQEALLSLVGDAGTRRSLAAEALRWLSAERSLDAMATGWLDLFRSYAAGRARPVAGRAYHGPAPLERVLVNVVPRQMAFYAHEAPRLAATKVRSTLHLSRG